MTKKEIIQELKNILQKSYYVNTYDITQLEKGIKRLIKKLDRKIIKSFDDINPEKHDDGIIDLSDD